MQKLCRKLEITRYNYCIQMNAILCNAYNLKACSKSILASNIMSCLEGNSILYNLQHSFRKSRSCETQLVLLLYDLSYNLDQGVQTDKISLEFAKAFDTVPHRRLLYMEFEKKCTHG